MHIFHAFLKRKLNITHVDKRIKFYNNFERSYRSTNEKEVLNNENNNGK